MPRANPKKCTAKAGSDALANPKKYTAKEGSDAMANPKKYTATAGSDVQVLVAYVILISDNFSKGSRHLYNSVVCLDGRMCVAQEANRNHLC